MRRLVLCSLLLLLAGCGVPTVTQPASPFTKIDGLYDYGAAGRDLKLVVHGNPFPALPQEAFVRAIEADLQTSLMRQSTHPTTRPGPSARDGYSLILVFQPSISLTGQAMCDGHYDQGAGGTSWFGGNGSGATLRVMATFCVSGASKTEIFGETDADSADDSRVTELMHQVMLALFRPDVKEGHGGGIGLVP